MTETPSLAKPEPKRDVVAFHGCCDDLNDAVRDGFLEVNPLDAEELVLPRRKLTDVAPNARAGNVLTGETYDPSTFALAYALTFCPFCGTRLRPDEDDDEDERIG